jgi:uncharacterized protein (TIGR02266 family)
MGVPALLAVKTVAIADDTAFVRERFRTALESAGHRAMVVGTEGELLAMLRDRGGRVDLVVMDARLSNGRGLQLLRSIRKLEGMPPIVVFSGTIATATEVRELTGLGVTGFINEYTAVQHILPSLAPHLFPDHYNRRSSPRVVVGISVTCRVHNTISTLVTLNIGQGGIAVRTANPLAAGTAIRVRLRLPGTKKEIDADARVAWTDRRVGMGLQFTALPTDQQDALDTYVLAHFFTNRKA